MCQPKGHNSVFELTVAGLECSLELVTIFNLEEVLGVWDAQWSEDPGFAYSIE